MAAWAGAWGRPIDSAHRPVLVMEGLIESGQMRHERLTAVTLELERCPRGRVGRVDIRMMAPLSACVLGLVSACAVCRVACGVGGMVGGRRAACQSPRQ